MKIVILNTFGFIMTDFGGDASGNGRAHPTRLILIISVLY